MAPSFCFFPTPHPSGPSKDFSVEDVCQSSEGSELELKLHLSCSWGGRVKWALAAAAVPLSLLDLWLPAWLRALGEGKIVSAGKGQCGNRALMAFRREDVRAGSEMAQLRLSSYPGMGPEVPPGSRGRGRGGCLIPALSKPGQCWAPKHPPVPGWPCQCTCE